MNGPDYLAELARQVRGHTLRILEAAQPDWLLWAPAGTSNHILWHAGHALWLQDALCVKLLTGKSELPPGWAETFGMDCRPVATTTDWPSREEVARLLESQLERVLALLASDVGRRVTESTPAGGKYWEVACRIIHGWHDEARHQGEMYLLLKMQRGMSKCEE